MKRIIFYILILLLVAGFCIFYQKTNYIEVDAEFPKLRPQRGSVDVYYNGYKMGYMNKLRPCGFSKNICANLFLNKKDMFLPSNLTVLMKQKRIHERKFKDYVEIIYPNEPSFESIKNGSVVKGELAQGFHNYLEEEVSHNEMEIMKDSLVASVQNLEKTTYILIDLFNSLNEIVEGSKVNLTSSSKSFANTMKNLDGATRKIDNSIDSSTIRNILNDLNYSMNNLGKITDDAKNFTNEISASGSNLATTLSYTNSITSNLDEILQGVNCNLSKSFGGLRILFGKTTR